MSSKEKAISNVGTGCEYQHQQARFLPVKVDSTEADSESSLIPGIHFEDSWYKMDNLETGGTRGMAVIINTHEIPCMGIRSETEEEFMMISKAFGGILRFELKRYDNVSLEKMRRAFADLASVDHSQSDCFVCFVYSHGKDDVIVCSDGETVRAQDIFCAFTESACPSLAGKPKLFFFEVTHGGHENQAYPKPCSLHPDSSSVTTTHRTPADLFIFYNRTQGNDSRRDRCCGSLFIQTLCQVLERYYCTRNFEAMMQTVMLLLAGRNVSPLPVMYSTFTKNLRFLPQCSRNTKASSERQEQSVWRQAFEGYKGQQREAGTVSMETGSLTTGTKMSDHIISAAKGTGSAVYSAGKAAAASGLSAVATSGSAVYSAGKAAAASGLSAVATSLQSTVPIPVILPSQSEGSVYEFQRDVLEHSMWNGVENLPVVVVSIAGVFRCGKSFLLDYFIRYLEHLERHRSSEGWLDDATTPLTGFSWRNGREKITTGIQLWGKIFKIDTPRWGRVAVVLMDTEGTDDYMSTIQSNSTLFSLAVLLSSTMIYNVMRSLNQGLLEDLQFFVSCASVLKGAQDCKDAQKMFALDSLLFLARDWENAQEIPYGLNKEGDFHGVWLTPSHSTSASLKSIQRGIKQSIKSTISFLMPHPGDQIKQPDYDGRSQGLCEEFKQCLDSLASLLFSTKRLRPKMLNGRPVTCSDFKGLLLTYSSVCKHGKLPEVQTVTDQAAYVHNQKILKHLDHEYESAMADVLKRILEKQGEEDKTVALEKEHNRLKQEALSKLGNTPVMGDKMRELQEQLSQMMEMFYTNCMQTIVLATKEAELQELRRRHEEDEEVARHKEELINELTQRYEESRNAKEAVIASHMEKQGVHLEEEDKEIYAHDLASSGVILRVLKIIWDYVSPGVLTLLKENLSFLFAPN